MDDSAKGHLATGLVVGGVMVGGDILENRAAAQAGFTRGPWERSMAALAGLMTLAAALVWGFMLLAESGGYEGYQDQCFTAVASDPYCASLWPDP